MKVSIITICYNSAQTIAETINSVVNQTYVDIEYIIVDGGSSDSTLKIINSFQGKVAKVISEKDEGIYDAMNKGLRVATGDIIGFINADDVINSNDCIEKVVQQFISSESDVVYGDKIYVDPSDASKVVRYWKAGNYNKENYKKGWMPPHLSTYIKKELYDKYGEFRTGFKIAGDYELMLRFIYKNDARTTYLPIPIAKMRAGGISNSSLSNIIRSNIEVYKSWKINEIQVSPLIVCMKPFKKVFQLRVI